MSCGHLPKAFMAASTRSLLAVVVVALLGFTQAAPEQSSGDAGLAELSESFANLFPDAGLDDTADGAASESEGQTGLVQRPKVLSKRQVWPPVSVPHALRGAARKVKPDPPAATTVSAKSSATSGKALTNATVAAVSAKAGKTTAQSNAKAFANVSAKASTDMSGNKNGVKANGNASVVIAANASANVSANASVRGAANASANASTNKSTNATDEETIPEKEVEELPMADVLGVADSDIENSNVTDASATLLKSGQAAAAGANSSGSSNLSAAGAHQNASQAVSAVSKGTGMGNATSASTNQSAAETSAGVAEHPNQTARVAPIPNEIARPIVNDTKAASQARLAKTSEPGDKPGAPAAVVSNKSGTQKPTNVEKKNSTSSSSGTAKMVSNKTVASLLAKSADPERPVPASKKQLSHGGKVDASPQIHAAKTPSAHTSHALEKQAPKMEAHVEARPQRNVQRVKSKAPSPGDKVAHEESSQKSEQAGATQVREQHQPRTADVGSADREAFAARKAADVGDADPDWPPPEGEAPAQRKQTTVSSAAAEPESPPQDTAADGSAPGDVAPRGTSPPDEVATVYDADGNVDESAEEGENKTNAVKAPLQMSPSGESVESASVDEDAPKSAVGTLFSMVARWFGGSDAKQVPVPRPNVTTVSNVTRHKMTHVPLRKDIEQETARATKADGDQAISLEDTWISDEKKDEWEEYRLRGQDAAARTRAATKDAPRGPTPDEVEARQATHISGFFAALEKEDSGIQQSLESSSHGEASATFRQLMQEQNARVLHAAAELRDDGRMASTMPRQSESRGQDMEDKVIHDPWAQMEVRDEDDEETLRRNPNLRLLQVGRHIATASRVH